MYKILLIFALFSPSFLLAAPLNIAVFGDSLSTGYGIKGDKSWVTLLQKKLNKQGIESKVNNASISGDTTSNGLNRLKNVLALKPDIIIIELGGNDGLRGLSLKYMRANLNAMIQQSIETGTEVLLIGMRLPANFGPAYTEKFHQIYFDLAEQLNVTLVPFLMEGVALDKTLMQADGIHPNEKAQSKLLDNVWLQLEPMLKAGLKQQRKL